MTICEAMKAAPVAQLPPPTLLSTGVTINLRARQRLALGAQCEYVYIVLAGVLFLESTPHATSRQILDLYYPGDIVRTRVLPNIPGTSLIAAVPSEVARINLARLEGVLESDPEARHWFDCAMVSQYPRRLLHIATVGNLSGEERVVSLLVELACRVGNSGYENARTFELPLSRTDMADYLSLNADTLSRIMSRLRQSGVLGMAGRSRGYAPNFADLCRLTPVADTIRALHCCNGNEKPGM